MNATILIMPHIGEYIADIGNFPPCSQLERQEERGGSSSLSAIISLCKFRFVASNKGYQYGKYELIFFQENEK